MERPSMVHTVTVDHAGDVYRADYFVQDGIIHASLDGHVLLSPVTNVEPADTVRTLLRGHLIQRTRKIVAVADWSQRAHHRQDTA